MGEGGARLAPASLGEPQVLPGLEVGMWGRWASTKTPRAD